MVAPRGYSKGTGYGGEVLTGHYGGRGAGGGGTGGRGGEGRGGGGGGGGGCSGGGLYLWGVQSLCAITGLGVRPVGGGRRGEGVWTRRRGDGGGGCVGVGVVSGWDNGVCGIK